MFNNNVEPLENLIDQFAQFPGIGRKSAVRMAYQVMSMPPKQAMELAKAIEHAKSDLHRCRICQDYTTGDVCKICASQKRDRSIICVVEGPRDIKSIERTHEYNGLYHVLHGLISPMDGIGAEQRQRGHHGHQPDGGGRGHGNVYCQTHQTSGHQNDPPGLWPARRLESGIRR